MPPPVTSSKMGVVVDHNHRETDIVSEQKHSESVIHTPSGEISDAQREMLEHIQSEIQECLETDSVRREGFVTEVMEQFQLGLMNANIHRDEVISMRIEPRPGEDEPYEIAECKGEIGGERVMAINGGIVFSSVYLLADGERLFQLESGVDDLLEDSE